MSRFWQLSLLIFIPFLFNGCASKVEEGPKVIGSGKKETSERELADFDKVELTTFGEMQISIGEKFSVKVDIDDSCAVRYLLLRDFETLAIVTRCDEIAEDF